MNRFKTIISLLTGCPRKTTKTFKRRSQEERHEKRDVFAEIDAITEDHSEVFDFYSGIGIAGIGILLGWPRRRK